MAITLRLLLLCAFGASIIEAISSSCLIVRDRTSAQDVKIEAHGANAVRVRAIPAGGQFKDEPDVISALITTNSTTVSECSTVTLSKTEQVVTSGNLKAAVGADGRLVFTRVSDGKVLLTEKAVRNLRPTTTVPPVPGFLALDLSFEAVVGERIYGLGQHAAFSWDHDFPKDGRLDQKGVPKMLMEPHDGDVSIPVAHSSEGYVFLSNLPSTGSFEFNTTGSFWRHDAVLQADMWVATTSDSPPHAVSPWQQLQSSYADATGHSPVWPEWTSGFWQCKLRYSNQTQIMAVANEYVRRGIPLSLIIIDFFSWNDPVLNINTIGDETLPASCWPDPKLMVDQLKEIGVELMVSPYSHSVGKQSHNWAEAEANKYLATDKDGNPAKSYAGGYAYDLYNPDARAYAWDAMQKGYVNQYGLHHWWLDCDEPCGGTNDGSYATDWLYNSGKWPAAFVGSAYPTMLDRTVYDGMGAPGKKYQTDNVMLGRAAWAGSQRYGGGVWSGDTQSTWEDFNQQFKAGLNMVMSGIVYWTTE
jgi:alpha-D-xyloside xylohydrolase